MRAALRSGNSRDLVRAFVYKHAYMRLDDDGQRPRKSAPCDGRAGHAGGGCRADRQPFRSNRLAALLASAVVAVLEAGKGVVQLGEVMAGSVDQGRHLRALEGDRRALGIMLIVRGD